MPTFDERFALPVDQNWVGSIPPETRQAMTNRLLESALPVEYQEPLFNDPQISKGAAPLNRLFGTGTEERFQTWPERMVRSGAALPGDVLSGAEPILGENGRTSEKVIERTQDLAGMAGMGGIGMTPKNALGTSGSRIKEYPIAPKDKWYGEANYETAGGRMETMTPDEFLSKSRPMKIDEIARENINDLKKHILEGKELDPLKLYEKGKEDGRHRAIAARELGIEEVPVINFREDTRAATGLGAVNQSGFYSKLERAIGDAKIQKGTPDQWLGYLKNNGIKPEEIEFALGNLPNKQLSKAELEAHVAENGVKVGEVWKGKPGLQERVDRLVDEGYDWATANELAMKDFGGKENTKFAKYQLPGGENYRELLLTLPSRDALARVSPEEAKAALDTANSRYREALRAVGSDRDRLIAEANQRANEAMQVYDQVILGRNDAENYRSSHWDEPNVLANIRMNDREVPGVGKTLHVEEIQSDWHQAGRKQGYKDPTIEKRIEDNYKQTEKAKKELWDKSANIDEIEAVLKPLQDERAQLLASATHSVPQAPFKKSWDELALKRVINEAVKNGYDAVSWTPGEAQALRYQNEVRQKINTVDWHNKSMGKVNENGQKQILVDAANGEVTIIVDKNGKVTGGSHGELIGKNLDQVLGKDFARQILEKPEGNIDAKGYVMGAEPMKAFYDKMLVDKANALVKKMGGKVEYENIPSAENFHQETRTGRHTQKIQIIKITPAMREKIAKEGFPLFSSPALVPVDQNPFEPKLVPVDGNPFQ